MKDHTHAQLLWPSLAATVLLASTTLADEVDFEGLGAGQILGSVTSADGAGPIGVNGFNPTLGSVNAAVVFDTANPTGGDFDLGTPNSDFGGPGTGGGGAAGAAGENSQALGMVLIVDEHLITGPTGFVTDPDDAAISGVTLELDFSALGSVTVNSVDYIDVELGRTGSVALFGVKDEPLGEFSIAAVGNNGVGSVDAGETSGVLRMLVTFGGSGALAGVDFEINEPFVFCDSTDNSTGLPALIDWAGTTSIVNNDFELVFSGLPLHKPAYLIYGRVAVNIPFGDVTRCVGGQLFRYKKIPDTGATGMLDVPFDFTQPPISGGPGQIVPGTEFYFQAWFRDPTGMSGFNTTQGICVTFAP